MLATVALSWVEVRQLEDLMQPSYGAPEVTLGDLFPLRPAWMRLGACREPHPEANWFPNRGGDAGPKSEAARAVCTGCPAREPCLAYALANPELVGIWGGTTNRERRLARRAP